MVTSHGTIYNQDRIIQYNKLNATAKYNFGRMDPLVVSWLKKTSMTTNYHGMRSYIIISFPTKQQNRTSLFQLVTSINLFWFSCSTAQIKNGRVKSIQNSKRLTSMVKEVSNIVILECINITILRNHWVLLDILLKRKNRHNKSSRHKHT